MNQSQKVGGVSAPSAGQGDLAHLPEQVRMLLSMVVSVRFTASLWNTDNVVDDCGQQTCGYVA